MKYNSWMPRAPRAAGTLNARLPTRPFASAPHQQHIGASVAKNAGRTGRKTGGLTCKNVDLLNKNGDNDGLTKKNVC